MNPGLLLSEQQAQDVFTEAANASHGSWEDAGRLTQKQLGVELAAAPAAGRGQPAGGLPQASSVGALGSLAGWSVR